MLTGNSQPPMTHLRTPITVQGSYSDLLVYLSNVYSEIRGDQAGQKNEDSAQGFVRSTTKYWVRTDDATQVKHHILQHLPVFQYATVGAHAWSCLSGTTAMHATIAGVSQRIGLAGDPTNFC